MIKEDKQKIRAFIALELSDEAKDEMVRIIDALKKADADVKWVKPQSMHLTLKFLGYVPEEKISPITEHLKEIAASAEPFDITLNDIGVFPSWNYVRVLWVGIGEGSSQVKDLAEEVEEAMASEGFEKEKRPFSSHLTIARVRKAKNKDQLKELASSTKVNPASSRISKIVLFKSTLTPQGAIYTPLVNADFKK